MNSLLLWAAIVRTKSFEDRLRAAQAIGAQEMSVFPLDAKHFTQAGTTTSQMRSQLTDAGVRVSVIDPLATWLPGSVPPQGASESDREFTQFSEAEVFQMAESLGADSINAIESFGAKIGNDDIVETICGPLGPEFFSDASDALTATEAAVQAAEATLNVLSEAQHNFAT